MDFFSQNRAAFFSHKLWDNWPYGMKVLVPFKLIIIDQNRYKSRWSKLPKSTEILKTYYQVSLEFIMIERNQLKLAKWSKIWSKSNIIDFNSNPSN